MQDIQRAALLSSTAWANSQYDRLPNLAAHLVRRNVSVIFAPGGPPSASAAKNATTTIPIVFLASDPLRFGLVKSLSHPEGNLTGVGVFTASIGSKRLGNVATTSANGQSRWFPHQSGLHDDR